MDDRALTSFLGTAYETERATWQFLMGASDSPFEVTEAWRAYRHALGLRKSLEKWVEIRRACQAGDRNTRGAVEA